MYSPTVQMETITVVRPLKVIALICLLAAVLLLIISLACTTWLRAQGFRQGLFEECMDENRQAPFGDAPPAGQCQRVKNRRDKVYVHVVAALVIIAGLVTVLSACLTTIGLKSANASRKYIYYRTAMYIAIIAVALEAAALVAFPVCFYLELKKSSVKHNWKFDWAYGVAWGALIFTVGACLLLICDKEREEVYYKEKTIMHPNAGKEASA